MSTVCRIITTIALLLQGLFHMWNNVASSHPPCIIVRRWRELNIVCLLCAFILRISKLTRLPDTMIEGNNFIQVVRYTADGHYNAHHDSGDDYQYPCCHLVTHKRCNICRWAVWALSMSFSMSRFVNHSPSELKYLNFHWESIFSKLSLFFLQISILLWKNYEL